MSSAPMSAAVASSVARLTLRIKQEAADGPVAPLIGGLQCLKGVGPITALTWVAELGDLTRFRRPRMLMAYSGLTPSEYSLGQPPGQ